MVLKVAANSPISSFDTISAWAEISPLAISKAVFLNLLIGLIIFSEKINPKIIANKTQIIVAIISCLIVDLFNPFNSLIIGVYSNISAPIISPFKFFRGATTCLIP
ncbi:MAG: hypothetical protein M0P73_13495 [Syntrophobacterales bacterium]|nr:hypothetical protein [Syntrophobacterales bacterium]